MDEEKSVEIASCLEEIKELMQRLLEFSNILVKDYAETGLLTIEQKKEFDNLAFECRNVCSSAELLLDSQEVPM